MDRKAQSGRAPRVLIFLGLWTRKLQRNRFLKKRMVQGNNRDYVILGPNNRFLSKAIKTWKGNKQKKGKPANQKFLEVLWHWSKMEMNRDQRQRKKEPNIHFYFVFRFVVSATRRKYFYAPQPPYKNFLCNKQHRGKKIPVRWDRHSNFKPVYCDHLGIFWALRRERRIVQVFIVSSGLFPPFGLFWYFFECNQEGHWAAGVNFYVGVAISFHRLSLKVFFGASQLPRVEPRAPWQKIRVRHDHHGKIVTLRLACAQPRQKKYLCRDNCGTATEKKICASAHFL